MTEYTPRNSQDLNPLLASSHLVMSHNSNNSGASYMYNNSQIPYTTINTLYPTYTTTYSPSHSTTPFPTESSHMALQYQQSSAHYSTTLSQQRTLAQSQYLPTRTSSNQRYCYSNRSAMGQDAYSLADTEEQTSFNENSMLSEPVVPPLEGYPDVQEFDQLMRSYVQDLSPKKQDKALIHAKRAENIRRVLIDKKTTAVESAQFRFWVKKMFTLQPNDPKVPDRRKKICHEGKPVAVREKLFKILTSAHKQCQHGGRDKTSAQVRRIYSWVPKELISRFVKLCPTCQIRRGTARASPPVSEKDSISDYLDQQSPPDAEMLSPPESRRSSIASRQCGTSAVGPGQASSYNSAFQTQNRWMCSAPQTNSPISTYSGAMNVLIPAPLHTLGSNVSSPVNYSTSSPQSMNGHHTVMGTTYLTNTGSSRHQRY